MGTPFLSAPFFWLKSKTSNFPELCFRLQLLNIDIRVSPVSLCWGLCRPSQPSPPAPPARPQPGSGRWGSRRPGAPGGAERAHRHRQTEMTCDFLRINLGVNQKKTVDWPTSNQKTLELIRNGMGNTTTIERRIGPLTVKNYGIDMVWPNNLSTQDREQRRNFLNLALCFYQLWLVSPGWNVEINDWAIVPKKRTPYKAGPLSDVLLVYIYIYT